MVLVIFCIGSSIGKAKKEICLNEDIKIAKPIFIIEEGEKINLNYNQNRGYYNLKIKNYDEKDNITEIQMKYSISVINNIQDIVFIKIYKENKEIVLKNNKTEEFTIKNDEKQMDNYKIEIICNKERITEDIFENIDIKVLSRQINR